MVSLVSLGFAIRVSIDYARGRSHSTDSLLCCSLRAGGLTALLKPTEGLGCLQFVRLPATPSAALSVQRSSTASKPQELVRQRVSTSVASQEGVDCLYLVVLESVTYQDPVLKVLLLTPVAGAKGLPGALRKPLRAVSRLARRLLQRNTETVARTNRRHRVGLHWRRGC